MQKYRLLFIDDSGDPGITRTLSPILVMAAVVFDTPSDAMLAAEQLRQYKTSLGWSQKREFKFHKDRKQVILGAIGSISANYHIEIISINKQKLSKSTTESLYLWTLGELIKLCAQDNDDIHIDGKTSKRQKSKNKAYIRQKLHSSGNRTKSISFEDSQKVILIQLADLIVGSARRMLLSNKPDDIEYVCAIRTHIKNIHLLP